MSEEDFIALMKKQSEAAPRLKKPKKVVIPRREPSVVIPERKPVFVSADKTTCAECPCFPKEDPYRKPKKLIACQKSPRLLYELAAEAVDSLPLPAAFAWSETQVADWIAEVVGLPQYRDCILDNHINGLRLLMLEDPSKLPEINIHYFEHIKTITSYIRKVYSTDFVRFLRSIGLPPRRPLVHSTWFKSRTGPTWGIRQNWSRTDIFRWMKIIMPEPLHLDHWDLVWYQQPDFPKVRIARVTPPAERDGDMTPLPRYKPVVIENKEYKVPRKFIIHTEIPAEEQFIWMEHRAESLRRILEEERREEIRKKLKKKKRTIQFSIKEDSTLLPKKITTEGLGGKDLILARRLKPKPKFLTMRYDVK